ncbi:MAG: DUF11 domain-containing protein [Candidatus Absconditabacterales bacterium]
MQGFFVGLLMIMGLLGSSAFGAQIYVSTGEIAANDLTGQMQSDTLDDYWKSGFDSVVHSGYFAYQSFLVTGATTAVGTSFVTYASTQCYTVSGVTVQVSLRSMTGGLFGQLEPHTASYPEWNSNAALQDAAPKPFSLLGTNYWNEDIGSSGTKNAVLFDFGQPVYGFGVRVGDLETRSDGSGVLATVQLFDGSGTLIVSTGIVPSSGTNQSLCGGSSTGCGNGTTRFVGFTDNQKTVQYMLIIVGDNDTTGDATMEHLSFIAPTLACPLSDVAITKSVNKSYVISGDLLTYTLYISNSGYGVGWNTVISDYLGSGLYYSGYSTTLSGLVVTTGINFLSGFINLSPFQTGTITLTAYVGSGVLSGDTLINVAQIISAFGDTNISNNTAQVVTTGTWTGGLGGGGSSSNNTTPVVYLPGGSTYVRIPLPGEYIPGDGASDVDGLDFDDLLNNGETPQKIIDRKFPNIDIDLPDWFTAEHLKGIPGSAPDTGAN